MSNTTTKSPATYRNIKRKPRSCTDAYRDIREGNPSLPHADIDYIVDSGVCETCGEYVGAEELDISQSFCGHCEDWR